MSFARKCTAVIDHTKIPSTQSNLPICLVLTDPELKQLASGGYMNNASAYDTGVSVDGGATWTQPFEIESYDSATPKLVIWTTPASLSASVDGSFILGFGDPALNTNPSSTSVWPSQYVMVHHYPNGSTITVLDSTANGNNGTNNGATATAGLIGGGAAFSGSAQYIDVADSAALDPSVLDVSFSLKSSPAGNKEVVSHGNDSQGWYVETVTSPSGALRFVTTSAHDATASMYDNSGYSRIHIIHDGSNDLFYSNGSLISTIPDATTITNYAGVLVIGAWTNHGFLLTGNLDELRIANTKPTQDWITVENNNQSSPSAGGFYVSTTFAANSSGNLFRQSQLAGLGAGGPFFQNPLN